MTHDDITIELARRCIPADATPEEKATKFCEIETTVKAAGGRAVASWVLVEKLDAPDLFAAFRAQVEAFKATAPSGPPPRPRGRVTRSSYLGG